MKCANVCIDTHTYIYIYICTHTRTYIYIYMHMCIKYTRSCIHVHVCTRTHFQNIFMYEHVHMCAKGGGISVAGDPIRGVAQLRGFGSWPHRRVAYQRQACWLVQVSGLWLCVSGFWVCGTGWCLLLQRVGLHCSVSQYVVEWCAVLQCFAVFCSVWSKGGVVCCSVITYTCLSVLHRDNI